MATQDIIARLRLNGEQFTAEHKKRFAGFEAAAKRSADVVRSSLTGILAGVSVAGLARGYIELADQAKGLTSQLKLATAESGSFAQAQEDVARIAATTRNGLEATTSLYGNFVRTSRELGKGQDEAAVATETFSKALKIGGASAAEAESATLQFGQALASGALRGDEFNSIAEASPRLLRLLSDSMDVPIGKLRQLAEDGKLTSDVLYDALTDAKVTSGIDAEFRQLPVTFDEAMGLVHDSAVIAFGGFDRGGEFSTAIANFISDGATNFKDLEDAAEDFGIRTRSIIEGLASAFNPLFEAGADLFEFLGGGFQGIDISRDIQKSLDDIDAAGRWLSQQGLMGRGVAAVENRISGGDPFNYGGRYRERQAGSEQRLRSDAHQREWDAALGNWGFGRTISVEDMVAKPRPPYHAPDAEAERAAERARKDAERAAERAARQAERLTEQYQRQSAELKSQLQIADLRAAGLDYQADTEEALFRLHQQFPTLDKERLATLEQQTVALLRQKDSAAALAEISERLGRQASDSMQERARQAEEAERAIRQQQEEMAREQEDQVYRVAYGFERVMRDGSKGFWDDFEEEGRRVIALVAAQWALAMINGNSFNLTGAFNAATSQSGGVLGLLSNGGKALGGLFGGGGKSGGGSLGTLSGGLAEGVKIADLPLKDLGLASNGLSKALSAAGPYLALASAALPLVSGLFGKTKWGASTISFGAGGLTAGGATGNSASAERAATGSANSVVGGVNSIIEQLGGTLLSAPTITIGQRHGDYRVNTSGTSLKVKRGAKDFNEDQQAATQYAIQQMLSGAVIDGISQASQNVLKKSGQDLQAAISKAMLIESIPKQLMARLDPVGAAIDDLNAKWKKNIDALKEGGASAEQMADAQKLYRLELEEVKASTRSASASLKDFLADLNSGSSSPLSLRDQEKAARAALDPYLTAINAGQSIDQDKYLAAAQKYLDLERELNGSTSAYFAEFDRIQAATAKAISTIDNAQPIRTAADPFLEATAKSTQANAEINAESRDLLRQNNALLTQLVQASGGGGGSFFGGNRNFSR